MLPVVSNAESIVPEKSMHDTILPWRNGKNLKKDVILDCSMIKSKLSRAVLLYWKGVSNMSNKRKDNKGRILEKGESQKSELTGLTGCCCFQQA